MFPRHPLPGQHGDQSAYHGQALGSGSRADGDRQARRNGFCPFLGGGTTAHAAMLTGRKCIGVELSPEYAQLSADRLLNID
uniref:DNA methyltransferase n=1 Tax=uncultured Bilophila sp. TaxID=529385 RepID=UPI00345B8D57